MHITGEEDFNFFMAIHYPVTNLNIMDYNRVIRSLKGLSPTDFLEKVSESYIIRKRAPGESPKPTKKYESSLYLDKEWYYMMVKPEKLDESSPSSLLDCSLLTQLVLQPIL